MVTVMVRQPGRVTGMVRSQVILVVEDEVMIRMLMADVLRDEGYRVIEAANGDEGVAILQSEQDIDLIITDVRMPGTIDGIELTAISKRLQPHRPVIVVSGHLTRSAAHNANEFLPKPYVPSTYLKVVDKLIGPPCQNPPRNCAG